MMMRRKWRLIWRISRQRWRERMMSKVGGVVTCKSMPPKMKRWHQTCPLKKKKVKPKSQRAKNQTQSQILRMISTQSIAMTSKLISSRVMTLRYNLIKGQRIKAWRKNREKIAWMKILSHRSKNRMHLSLCPLLM